MARPLRIEYPNAFYHVTSRGNEKKEIFKSSADREKFLEYLESAVTRYGAVIRAYCLMNNHYHSLIETPLGSCVNDTWKTGLCKRDNGKNTLAKK